MDKQTLAALQDLHQRLRRVDSLTERDRQLVEQLQNDIQSLLSQSRKTEENSDAVRRQLEDAIQRLEVSHPDLTAVMARLVHMLTNLGI